MNFIPAKAKSVDKNTLDLDFFGIKARFTGEKDFEMKHSEVILGIRPEFIDIEPNGQVEGLAYSTLPAGMETTIKINLHGDILSAVQFGLIDYKVDEKIKFNIVGQNIIVFDKETKENIAIGSLKIVE